MEPKIEKLTQTPLYLSNSEHLYCNFNKRKYIFSVPCSFSISNKCREVKSNSLTMQLCNKCLKNMVVTDANILYENLETLAFGAISFF